MVEQAVRIKGAIVFTDTDGICDNRSAFPLFRDMPAAVKDVLAGFDQFF